MTSVLLHDIHMKRESKSYIDSQHAILTAAGWFRGPKHMLSGLSGMAFKMSVHEQLLSFSVSAYGQWVSEHKPAANNVGLLPEIDGGRTRHPSFRWYQEQAVLMVKRSLDRGLGAIYWLPEFAVISGYDDDDRVFYVQDGWSGEHQIVLYDNFGLNVTPFWYVETYADWIEIALEEQVLESVRLAIGDWYTPYKTLPDTAIASGKLAYAFLRSGLLGGAYDAWGAGYILDAYAFSRTEIRDYLRDVEACWPELREASEDYDEIVSGLPYIQSCVQTLQGGCRLEPEQIGELVDRLATAERLEDQAISRFERLSARYPDRARSTVPRWGTHSPR
ncbi:hypothetical protein [Paenibacillus guangzhouensis]|uniref:hypothetical protein n=1 Tax=Paenibacillus guangzhouensis TaxID=1473112 RepID=UPI001266EE08|nr:hypothetical protein [Paenibacillus guangzhouensis]